MKSRVLVIGQIGTDMVCSVDRLPISGETVLTDRCDTAPGGSALITALTLAEMGVEPVLCAAVGNDESSERVRSFCRKNGLDTRFIFTIKEQPGTMNLTLIDGTCGQHGISCPGAFDVLSEEHIEEAFTCLPDALYLQGDLGNDRLRFAASFAHEQGIPIFFDPTSKTTLSDLCALGELEIFMPSEQEVCALVGTTLRNQEEIMRACLAVSKKAQAKYYIVKLGERGAILYDGTYCFYSAAYEVEAVDKCYVGDIHSAIVTAEYLKKADARRAMEYANAGAALSVTKKGGSAAIPKAMQVETVVQGNLGGNNG